MQRRTFFKWATAAGALLILPPSVRPTKKWNFVEEFSHWTLLQNYKSGERWWVGWDDVEMFDTKRKRVAALSSEHVMYVGGTSGFQLDPIPETELTGLFGLGTVKPKVI